jgi:chloramphenicol-sensitive protein RarD
MAEGRKGVLAIVAASTIWGLSGLYFKAMAAVPPIEMLCHRTIWSAVFFALVIVLQGRGAEVRAVLAQPRRWRLLIVAAVMIALNWAIFIRAVQAGQALEAGLGYYIFPLVAVALGFLVRGERFTPLQGLAIAIAAAAVTLLGFGLGAAPWTALLLAGSFAAYGLIKGGVPIAPVVSVLIETLLLAPLALLWLWGVHTAGWSDLGATSGGVFGRDLGTSLLLIASGPVLTGGPLMLFSYAARRLRYSTVGLIQYLNPTLQVVVALAVFGEPFTRWHALALPLIWCGLAVYSLDGWRRRPLRRPEAGGDRGARSAGR